MLTAFRNHTWIEWAVYAACQLRRRGVATTLVYSSSEMKRIYPILRVAGVDQLGFWGGVEAIPDIRLVDLDHWLPAPGAAEAYREFAREFAPAVAAYDLHVEENEEGPLGASYRRSVARAEEMLTETAAALERILRVNPVSRLVCYSGLIGRSPAACEAARRAGIEVLTVEGWAWRPGHMVCNLGAPALEYNLQGWRRAMGDWDAAREQATRQPPSLPGRGARGRRGAAGAAAPRAAHGYRRAAAPGGGGVPRPSGPVVPARHQRGGGQLDPAPGHHSSGTSATGSGRRSSSSGPVPTGTSSCARIPTRRS